MSKQFPDGKLCHICGAKGYITGFGFDLCCAHREDAIEIAKQAVKAFVIGAIERHEVRLGLVDCLLKDFEPK